jgi:hypothetical protein
MMAGRERKAVGTEIVRKGSPKKLQDLEILVDDAPSMNATIVGPFVQIP